MELFGIEEPSPVPYISQQAVELLQMMLKIRLGKGCGLSDAVGVSKEADMPHEEALQADAGLAGLVEGAVDELGHDGVQLSGPAVVLQDGRGVPSQLQHHRLLARARLHVPALQGIEQAHNHSACSV